MASHLAEGLLATAIGLSVVICTGCTEDTLEARRANDIMLRNYATATRNLVVDCGATNTTSSILSGALWVNPGWKGWNGPYLTAVRPGLDYYGYPLVIAIESTNVVIRSAGPDGQMNTTDDAIVTESM
jgi:hypothetical protein